MWKSKIADQTAAGQVVVKKQSKVPGVMITQFVEELPDGKSTPDFQRKPIALTIQEGKAAMFRAMVSGEPKPEVTWKRAKGEMIDEHKFCSRYDENAGEYILEIACVSGDEGDIYKCFAVNEFGRAICTAALNVIEVGFKRDKEIEGPGLTADPAEFRKMLRKSSGREPVEKEKKEGEIDDKFWDLLLSSEKKDYERLCAEYGVTDFRWMLKKLNLLKKEREEEQSLYLNAISNLRHIEIKGDGSASFEIVLDLKDPNSRIFLYKDGVMVQYSRDMEMKHQLKTVGKKLVFTVKDLLPEDAGLYQLDVEEVNVLTTEFRIPHVDFIVKIQEVKAKEREDAIFECVLSHPFSKILWMGKNSQLENGDKFEITVSADKLIHRLRVKDCKQVDKGIYSAMAGIKTCSAWLTVDADSEPGKKKVRKTTQAGGAGMDLKKVAQEQQAKLQKEKEDKQEAMKKEKEEAKEGPDAGTVENGLDGHSGLDSGLGKDGSGLENRLGLDDGLQRKKGSGIGDTGLSGAVLAADKLVSTDDGLGGDKSRGIKDPGVQFVKGLSDLNAKAGQPAELVCKLSKDNCNGEWFKDGKKLLPRDGLSLSKDGASHKLKIDSCRADDTGKYCFDAEGCKTEAMITVKNQDPGAHCISGLSNKKAKGQPADPGVQFISELSDMNAKVGQPAEMVCKLSDENCNGAWFKDGDKLLPRDGLSLSKDGASHKLKIDSCQADDTGKYCFEAGGRKTEAMITVEDPGVQFLKGLSDMNAKAGQPAELVCKLNNEKCNGTWFKDGNMLSPRDGLSLSKDGASHKLKIDSCQADDTGKYCFEAEGRKTEAMITVEDPGVQFISGLSDTSTKVGQPAELVCKLSKENCNGAWFKDGKRLLPRDGLTLSKDGASQKLKIDSCQADDTGKYRFEAERRKTEAMIIVEDPGVQFIRGLSDTNAKEGQPAELVCKLSNENCDGAWFKDGNKLLPRDGLTLSKDGACHKLKIDSCQEDDTGKYRFEAEGRKTEAMIIVEGPEVQFISGLSDMNVKVGQPAELVCKLSKENCNGEWFKDGKKLLPRDGLTPSKDGACHKLKIDNCCADDTGKYRFDAEGRKTEAMIFVEDPPRFNEDALAEFSKPVIVKAGQNASFKMLLVGGEPTKVQWFKEEQDLLDNPNAKMEITSSHSRLLLRTCQRKDTGEIKLKVKNDYGNTEAVSKLIVLDKPSPPLGPVEVVENSASCIHIKWRPPKDNGGSQLQGYALERQQVGRNTWTKLGQVPSAEAAYKDSSVEHGRKYCYRVRAVNEEGVSEPLETEDIMAGVKAYPGPPAPPKVVSAFNDCINLTWTAPTNTGGSHILGYNLEKRKRGSNMWSPVNPQDEPIQGKKYAVKDVIVGMVYEFRVSAINVSGVGEPSIPSDFVTARDPKEPPGKVMDLKVTESTYTSLSLAWTKPTEEAGVQDEAKGYFVEIRPAESQDWNRCNMNPVIMTAFTVKSLKSMAMYWVRVIATNEGGEGVPQDLDNYITAMPPPVRPKFTDAKMKSFMVVRAGNAVRINVNFEASPWPDVVWLKDSVPIQKRVTISNTEGMSQLLIPSSERSDTGVYTIIIKNLVGQETFSVEIRVTDDPKPPGPVELEENVPGTVTVNWEPSPDEKRDDRLHYMVSQRDSTKQTWNTVADRAFNNKYTACNILPGHEYHFRIYAKNDMGMSEPSESPTWGTTRKREKFEVNTPVFKPCNLQSVPKFLVPLKMHLAPKGYECYMSCAVTGNPQPHITWYHNNISLNTNTNYYISNTCGVCSMLILRVGPKDHGEYTVMAENSLGRSECSTKLTVRE
ncbi:immunoglobulin-like and fibronectin type III domain-containing protein 1 isoform X2 [Conger conger]|uniref:immunoglobulin-like and fibronectin type III domain-containing protein 1 isoform X2 n=1 Tax=Conger conger TaxID=82655 RepID=UPI002A59D301|nr:immunoglobulin-like and fibronectin type III domain-containing protein 1 isoform X2 [Conger conger]